MRSWHGNLSPFGAWRTSGSFYPTDLFAASEPGIWLDPSDLTTLFQDSAGTTPVTAPGDPVSIALDKSQNLTVGSERITNGDFADGSTGWTINAAGANTISVANGAFTLTATGSADAATITQAWLGAAANGKTYEISFEVLTGSSGTIKISTLGINNTIGEHSFSATVGVKTFRLVAATSSTIGFSRVSGAVATAIITNISVKEIAGNHARQTTTASRPTYGVVPFGGRRNLLTYSEQFDNAIWPKTRASISANAVVAPDGTSTGDKFLENTSNDSHYIRVTGYASAQRTVSVYAKAAERSWVFLFTGTVGTVRTWFDLATGAVGTSEAGHSNAQIEDVGGGWYRCSVVASAAVEVGFQLATSNGNTSYLGDGTSGIYIWGAQLELGSAATAYQKVVSAFDVTEAGTVSLSYLSFDGVDDFLVTPTITPGTDKAQVFAGVRKLSDAAAGIVAELSAIYTGNTGVFALFAPTSPVGTLNYGWASKGTAGPLVAGTGFAAPRTDVLTGLGDIAADSAILRVNGAQAGSSASDQGTGNYLAYPIYIGRRGGTTLPFNGRIYGLITRFGANLSTELITSTEYWMNAKTGAY